MEKVGASMVEAGAALCIAGIEDAIYQIAVRGAGLGLSEDSGNLPVVV